MKIKLAKDYFDLGVITQINAVKNPDSPGWLMQIEDKNGKQQTLQTARNQAKSFATLDALVKDVERIGGSVSALPVKLQAEDDSVLWLLFGGDKAAMDAFAEQGRQFRQALQAPELAARIRRFQLEHLVEQLRQGKVVLDDGSDNGGGGPSLRP
jgi:hypothetical protein